MPFRITSYNVCYTKLLRMMMGHSSANLPKAQAIKDATMAHFILKNYKKGHTFIHYNGSFHSDYYEGILWYLKRERPDLKYVRITSYNVCYTKLLRLNVGAEVFIFSAPSIFDNHSRLDNL